MRLPWLLAHYVTDGVLDLLADLYEAQFETGVHDVCLAVA